MWSPRPLVLVGMTAVIAVACGSMPSTQEIALVGPLGQSTVVLVDQAGVVRQAGGVFGDGRPAWVEGFVMPHAGVLEIHWAAGCDDTTTITLATGAAGGLEVTIGKPIYASPSTCRPRGFVQHTLEIDLARAIAEDEVTITFEGREGG